MGLNVSAGEALARRFHSLRKPCPTGPRWVPPKPLKGRPTDRPRLGSRVLLSSPRTRRLSFKPGSSLTAKSPWAGSGSTHRLAHVRTGTCVQGAPVSMSHTRTHVNVHPACAPTCDTRVPARALVDMCVTHVWTRVPPAHTLTQPRALEPGKPSCPASPKPQVPTQLTQVSGFTRGAPRRHAACPSRPSLPSGGSERPSGSPGPSTPSSVLTNTGDDSSLHPALCLAWGSVRGGGWRGPQHPSAVEQKPHPEGRDATGAGTRSRGEAQP